MKINNNRDFESMQTEMYFNAESQSGSNMNMDYGMNNCQYNTGMNGFPCDIASGMNMMGETMPGVVCPPVYECPRETVCHRYICHEVPHIQPCNTRIINHHIYRHTFTPTYSCCEENEVQNVYERRCC